MSSSVRRELWDGIQSGVQERVQERINDEVLQIQQMDITRAAAALLEANVKEDIIERLLCKYWNLRPSEAHRFIREGEEERKI